MVVGMQGTRLRGEERKGAGCGRAQRCASGSAYRGDGDGGQGKRVTDDVPKTDAFPASILDPRVFHFAQGW